MHSSANEITSSALDTLMQDTWLLALAIRNDPPVTVDDALFQSCFAMIQQVQDKLAAAGASGYLAEEIKFAHCVFLDEAVMTQPDTDVSTWWRQTPLQGHFLDSLHGGEHFYEHIKKLLREPAPSEALLTCYHRMLLLGYVGKYRSENNDERQSLMRQLETQLPLRAGAQTHHDIVVSTGPAENRIWRSPQVILTALLLLAVGMWAGLRLFLLAR
ncbi:DotU family type IV/VI secretion system protein [Salmonella enterica subsp. enterica serovar Virchow]|nr:DotU family type IV/VI secretion system protein [Salmonella enterica subsp. enterica serovar Virchow]